MLQSRKGLAQPYKKLPNAAKFGPRHAKGVNGVRTQEEEEWPPPCRSGRRCRGSGLFTGERWAWLRSGKGHLGGEDSVSRMWESGAANGLRAGERDAGQGGSDAEGEVKNEQPTE